MTRFLTLATCLTLALFAAGCDDKSQTAQTEQSAAQTQDAVKDRLEEWMGTWNGPEGTYLKLEKSGDGYGVIIKDLDKEERYLGTAQGMRIAFIRGDKQEYIHFGPGRDTGMKWLADKPYCLIVKQGEGYCRDKM